MNYEKFKEYIDFTPVLNDDYKLSLLEDAKKYDGELLKQIIIIVYKSELNLIEEAKKLKKAEKIKKQINIETEEQKEKRKAEMEIDNFLEFNL